MRLIIPKEIEEKQALYAPYMHYVKGEGVVLVASAPPEIVKAREEVAKWFEDHREK